MAIVHTDRHLPYEEIDNLSNLFALSFDLEFEKLSESEMKSVLPFVLSIFLGEKLHTQFTTSRITSLTAAVYENSQIRDFVLSLSDRLGVMLGLGNVRDFLVEKFLSNGISHYNSDVNTTNPSPVFMPERVRDNIEVDSDIILSILKHNKWLTSIVLINLFLYKTNVFKNSAQTGETSRGTNSPSIEKTS